MKYMKPRVIGSLEPISRYYLPKETQVVKFWGKIIAKHNGTRWEYL